jgi:hypothetical protein
MRKGTKRRAALVALATALVVLALGQAASAFTGPAPSFTVSEVDKAGRTVTVGTWSYSATDHTLAGAPFVRSLTSTDRQGKLLPYVPYSGQDAYPSDTKMAVATRGFYLDDLATWVAGKTRIPLGDATRFNVTTADSASGAFYYPNSWTLAGVDDRYWYPSYNLGADPAKATWDDSTRVRRKAVLAITSSSARRYQTDPASPTDYAGLLAALGNLAASATDANSLQLWMGQVKGRYDDPNLGANAVRWVSSVTFMPAYLTIKPVVGGGTATVTTADGYLKATARERVRFRITKVQSGYQVRSVVVKDAAARPVALRRSDGVYSFTMPSSDATVAVRLVARAGLVPGRVTLLTVRAGSGCATLRWKKSASRVSGYQIGCRKSGSSRFVSVGKTRQLGKVVHGLRHGKTYTFRVRAYDVAGGTTRYGRWSRPVSVTVK